MTRYVATVASASPAADTFAFMADLRNFARWDQGVASVVQVQGDGGGPDAVFDVEVRTGRGTRTFRYRTVDYDAPRSLTVEAVNGAVRSTDRITVRSTGTTSEVTYDATLALRGPLAVFDRLLRATFDEIGDRAAAGLREALAADVRR